MEAPVATRDVGATLSAVACCPVADFERCVAAGGDDTLCLLAVREAAQELRMDALAV